MMKKSIPLLLMLALVLSFAFGTWYVKAEDSGKEEENTEEWDLEAALLSDTGAVIGNGEAYAGKVTIRLRIFLPKESEREETEDTGAADDAEKEFPFREEWNLSADSTRAEKLLEQALNHSESESEWKLLPPESGEENNSNEEKNPDKGEKTDEEKNPDKGEKPNEEKNPDKGEKPDGERNPDKEENPDEQKIEVYEKKIELGGSSDWDAHYSGSVRVEDEDGNSKEAAFAFALDMTPPEGEILVDSFHWNQLFYYPAGQNTIFRNREAAVSYRTEDSCSGVKQVGYLSSERELTEADLERLAWSSEKTDVISPGEAVYLYLRIEDQAGNISYINTPRILSDNQAPSAAIRIKTPEAADHIYREDVRADVVVTDEGFSSGLAQVWMQISRNGGMTWEKSEEFEAEANRSGFQRELFLSKEEYESDFVRIRVYAKDHAGNETLYETEPFFIDGTPPEVSVEWDSDSAEAVNGSLFSGGRSARIRVADQLPDPSGIRVFVSGKQIQPDWVEIHGGSKGTSYETELKFREDGEYELTVQAKDLAGNWSEMRRESFRIDQKPPACELIYGDGSVKNPGEYHDTRTLTVKIHDENLSGEETHLTVMEILPGEFREIKAESETWLRSGQEYRARFSFPEDGEYRILAESADLAGNHMQKLAEQAAIDTTAPELQVTGMEEGMTVSGPVSLQIEASDRFYQPNSLQVSLTSESGRDASALLAACRRTASGTGQSWELSYLSDGESWDDRYILSIRAADRSGKEARQEIHFSLNRYGSRYYTDPAFESQLDAYYLSAAPSFSIWEKNIGDLDFSRIVVSHDGKVKLLPGGDYQVEAYEIQQRWKVSRYFLPDSLFAEEGRYSVTFYSVDASGNRTDSEGSFRPIRFVVDHSAPTITLTDLEDGGYYPEESRQFSVTVQDNIRLKRLVVRCGDQHLEIPGEELEAERGICSLELFAGEDWQQLEIWAEDAAGNRSDRTSLQVMVRPEGNFTETVPDAENAASDSEKGEKLRIRNQTEPDGAEHTDEKKDTILISRKTGMLLALLFILTGIGAFLRIKSKKNSRKNRSREHRGKKEESASSASAESLQTEILIRKEETKEKEGEERNEEGDEEDEEEGDEEEGDEEEGDEEEGDEEKGDEEKGDEKESGETDNEKNNTIRKYENYNPADKK